MVTYYLYYLTYSYEVNGITYHRASNISMNTDMAKKKSRTTENGALQHGKSFPVYDFNRNHLQSFKQYFDSDWIGMHHNRHTLSIL